jgi:hypothetical protein
LFRLHARIPDQSQLLDATNALGSIGDQTAIPGLIRVLRADGLSRTPRVFAAKAILQIVGRGGLGPYTSEIVEREKAAIDAWANATY